MHAAMPPFRWCLLAIVASVSLNASAADTQARQLAASCSACHGTDGHSVGGTPVLAGLDREHFIRQMKDFQSGARPATVMHRHANGYSDSEIDKMASFFAAQKR